MTTRRTFIKLLGGAGASWPLAARAQQLERMRRIGVLMMYAESDAQAQDLVAMFRATLRDLGWTEDHNIQLDYRWATTDLELIQRFREGTRRPATRPHSFVKYTNHCVAAATNAHHPHRFREHCRSGRQRLRGELAEAGWQRHGFPQFGDLDDGKWLELLKEIAPRVARVAIFFNPSTAPYAEVHLNPFKAAAASLGVEAIVAPILDLTELDTVIAAQARDPNGGLIAMPDGFMFAHHAEIASMAARYRLPAVASYRVFAKAGGLLSYGNDILDNYRRAAAYVDRILKGEKPSELPVQHPVKFELVDQPQDCEGTRPRSAANAARPRRRGDRMMGWMAPLRHLGAKMPVGQKPPANREPSMNEITTIGLDLAKHVFQVHGVDAAGATVLRKQLRRAQVLAFFSRLPRCLVGMEACATAHYWARELSALGHEVRLMPAQYVKAYIKRNKNDAADAEAICEAVVRPTMRFVPAKTAEQQAAVLLHRGRERLVRQRTMLVNALRGHLAEFGVIAPQGLRNVGRLIAIIRDEEDARLPGLARQVLQVLAVQIEQLEAAITALEKQLMGWHKSNPVSQRLATIPGIGPIIATAIAAMVAEPSGFRSGREFAAWLGLVPRQNSTGGKNRLGGISKRGNQYLRRLLINGASANLLRSKATNADPWVIGLRRRRPSLVVAVALANKTARIAWAVMHRQENYQRMATAA